MAVSAVVATVASTVGSSVVQSNAAKKAAKQQTNAANQASATEQGFYNDAQGNLQPTIDTGKSATSKISDLEGLGANGNNGIMSTLQSLPGYQFSNTQGLKAVQNSASARGLGTSGAAQKGAATFSTGNANTYYNNYLTGLQSTANAGTGAAESLGGLGTTTGNEIGSNDIGAGNAQASATNKTGAVEANALNTVGQTPQEYSGINASQAALSAKLSQQGGSGNTSIYGSDSDNQFLKDAKNSANGGYTP